MLWKSLANAGLFPYNSRLMAQTRLYFAYGDSMNVNRLKKWLFQRGGRPDGIVSAQRAVLQGYTLAFNVHRDMPWKAGVANLEEDAKGSVEGVLMEIDNATESHLLKKEGVPAAAKRVEVTVVGDKEKTYEDVWAVIAPPTDGKTHAPSKTYMELLLQAAKDFEFSADYVKKLEKVKAVD